MPPPLSPKPSSVLDALNAAQRRAVSSDAATVAILAGPGSGKTHTLASRVVWLVDTVGYRPQDVVVATFTVKAAREMKERIARALGSKREGEEGEGEDRARRIVLGTFHSIARRYLAAYGQKIGLAQKFGIADDADSRAIISRICKRLQLACDPAGARAWISKKKAKGSEEGVAVPTKRQLSDKTPGLQELQTCYEEYQDHLRRSNLLDYDDLLVNCVELLRRFPSCVSNVQAVLIDEYQDTNGVQYELMKLFAQSRRRITIVGDPDQSIYGWRSAEIKNLWRLLRDYPGADEVSLEENYRSSQQILNMSLRVIQQDAKRYQKALKPIHGTGTRPVLRKLRTATAEAEWIVSEIRRTLMMSGAMMTHDDVAILLRSASLSRHVEAALGKAGVAYKMVGGFKFYERAEIKIILDYLRVIHQPDNNDALARILNVPRRGIGDGTIKSLVEEAERSSLSLWGLLTKHCRGERLAKTKIMKHAEQRISGELFRLVVGIRKRAEESVDGTPFSLVALIEQLLTNLRFQKFLQDSHPEDHEQRWANVQEFVTLAADFVRDLERAGDDSLPEIEGLQQSREIEVLPRFLANLALASDAQTGQGDEESRPVVTISTIHAAKGLEWPVVFVPAVYNGSIPHMRAEDNDEERRLLYVAMTRAQSLLYLSYPVYSSVGNGERNELSPFVAPLSEYFAKKGPLLDRPVMEQVSRILRRELPPDSSIFGSLPAMFSPEDNLFPEDPEAEPDADTTRMPYGENNERRTDTASRVKRRRLQGPKASEGEGGDEDEHAWWKERSTTMQQSSNFTVASLPGFVSAGAHQAALAAAVATDRVAAQQQQQKEAPRRSTNRRPADQRSIMGFVRSRSGPAATNNDGPDRRQNYHPPAPVPPVPGIAPELASHRLGNARAPTRPPLPLPPPPRREENGADAAGSYEKPYACFSSSPVRPRTADGDGKENVPAVSGPGQGKQQQKQQQRQQQQQQNTRVEPPPPAGSPARAAACLHLTTCNVMPKGLAVGGGGVGGGLLRRPTGLARQGLAPMERLRKPFKPPTMNRSVG